VRLDLDVEASLREDVHAEHSQQRDAIEAVTGSSRSDQIGVSVSPEVPVSANADEPPGGDGTVDVATSEAAIAELSP